MRHGPKDVRPTKVRLALHSVIKYLTGSTDTLARQRMPRMAPVSSDYFVFLIICLIIHLNKTKAIS